MKRLSAVFCLSVLLCALCAATAWADMGPKPMLTVRVEHAPEGLYYLDLLSPGPADGSANLTEEESDALDPAMVETLLSAVPEGYHACLLQGTGIPLFGSLTSEDAVHVFSYVGVPKTYRIIIATADGESWVSPEFTRQVLQSSVTVDWAAKTASAPPVWKAYALELLATLLPTLIIEGTLLFLFCLWQQRRNRSVFLLVNLLTQAAVFLILGRAALTEGVGFGYYLLFLLTEAGVLLAEVLLYIRLFSGCSRRRAAAYGVAANLCSAAAGWFLAHPVWDAVTRLC